MTANRALFEAQIVNRDILEEQFEVKRWLQGKSEGTQNAYLSALKAFTEYTKHAPKELIDLAEEDRKRSLRERGDPEARSRNKDKFRNELSTAIELKYVVNNSLSFIDEVKKDIKKLSIGLKYQSFEAYNLVFCNNEYHYISELAKIIKDTDSTIKNILVMSHYTNDKKNTPKPITNGWSF